MADDTKVALLQRLRERRIFRWGIAYAGAAWVLLQVAELVFGIFDWPTVYLRWTTVALTGGFFAMLILVWFHGERGQQKASALEIVLLVLITIATAGVIRYSNLSGDEIAASETVRNIFAEKSSRRLTASSFYESDPSWSPDSQALAFASQRSGNGDIWLVQRSGAVTQLTFDEAEDVQPAWSPNGSTILFVSPRSHGSNLDRSVFYGYTIGGDIWSVAAFGGTPRKLIDNGSNPAWSPDGRWFAFDSSRGSAHRIWIAMADGTSASPVSSDTSDLANHVRPAWSPDGRWIVYERQPGTQASAAALFMVSADGLTTFQLTDGKYRDMSPAWVDADSLVFASDRGGALNLWQLDVDFERRGARGAAVQITRGAGEDFAPAVASDGTLAYSTSRRLQNLWKVDVDPESLRFDTQPERVMSGSWNDFAPALSADNSALAFSSDRSGGVDIWVLRDGSTEPVRLTDRSGQDLQPVWSPDGSKLAFFSDERGNNDIWILPVGGGPAVTITPAESNDVNPYWSSDGSEIGFMSDRTGQSEVWSMAVDGSSAVRLTSIGALGHTARWSPDDNWLLFTSVAEGDRDIWAVSRDGSDLRRLTDAPTQDAHGLWSPDGKTVLYLSDHQKMFARPFATNEHRLLFDLGETIDYVHLSPDGTTFVFTRQKIESDIWLIE